MKKLNLFVLLVSGIIMLNGCGGGGNSSGAGGTGSNPSTPSDPAVNTAPVMDAIANRSVTVTYAITEVNPNGSDSDGDTLAYSCYYDTTVDGVVGTANECSGLSGMSFNAVTGRMNWTPVSGSHGGVYEFKIAADDGEDSTSKIFTVSVARCPSNYVLVYGDATMGTSDFCAAKYEMKLNKGAGIDATGNNPDTGWDAGWTAVSGTTGKPWVYIAQTEAITSCENLTDSNFDYTLMSNDEWQTIARDAENVNSNWTGGTVGNGKLYMGHSDGTPNSALAAGADGSPYLSTWNTSADPIGSGGEQKRTHTLSSGEVIWDMSGNVREVVYFGTTGTANYTVSGNYAEEELNSAAAATIYGTGNLLAKHFQPENSSYDSDQYTGMLMFNGNIGTYSGEIVVRGFGWTGGFTGFTGLFSALLDGTNATANSAMGFRCTSSLAIVGY